MSQAVLCDNYFLNGKAFTIMGKPLHFYPKRDAGLQEHKKGPTSKQIEAQHLKLFIYRYRSHLQLRCCNPLCLLPRMPGS